MKSFRRILIRELVVLHALMVAVGSLLAWVGLTRWANQQAEVRVTTDLRQLDRALSDRFPRLEQLADVLARLWR